MRNNSRFPQTEVLTNQIRHETFKNINIDVPRVQNLASSN